MISHTVLDLSDVQLSRDLEAAATYGYSLATVLGGIRDLFAFDDRSFDVVLLAFIPPFLSIVVYTLMPQS